MIKTSDSVVKFVCACAAYEKDEADECVLIYCESKIELAAVITLKFIIKPFKPCSVNRDSYFSRGFSIFSWNNKRFQTCEQSIAWPSPQYGQSLRVISGVYHSHRLANTFITKCMCAVSSYWAVSESVDQRSRGPCSITRDEVKIVWP